jgi:hypothetical protein
MKNASEYFKVGKWYICKHKGSECVFRPSDGKKRIYHPHPDVINRPVLILKILAKSNYGSGVQNYADCEVLFGEEIYVTTVWDGAYEECKV